MFNQNLETMATTETTQTQEVKKTPKTRTESNEALAERLLKEKADEARILKEFTSVYKAKSGVTDKVFIAARAKIYMGIAIKRAAAKAANKK
jgi:hypothetical protein